jgi:hypothetical protein
VTALWLRRAEQNEHPPTHLAAAAEANGRSSCSKVLHNTAQQLLASPQLPRLQHCRRRQLQVHCRSAAGPPGRAGSEEQLAELRAGEEAVPAGERYDKPFSPVERSFNTATTNLQELKTTLIDCSLGARLTKQAWRKSSRSVHQEHSRTIAQPPKDDNFFYLTCM